jgi:hypothetical protein
MSANLDIFHKRRYREDPLGHEITVREQLANRQTEARFTEGGALAGHWDSLRWLKADAATRRSLDVGLLWLSS